MTFISDGVLIEKMKEVIFKSGYCAQLDNGGIDFESVLHKTLEMMPVSTHKICTCFFNEWHLYKYPRFDMIDIIIELKSKGYGIFLCSNAAERFHDYKNTYEVFKYFDDLVISADINVSKPGPVIYQTVLDRNHLDAKKCLFIDDLAVNIDGAKAVGIAGYHYNGNADMFRLFLKNINVL